MWYVVMFMAGVGTGVLWCKYIALKVFKDLDDNG